MFNKLISLILYSSFFLITHCISTVLASLDDDTEYHTNFYKVLSPLRGSYLGDVKKIIDNFPKNERKDFVKMISAFSILISDTNNEQLFFQAVRELSRVPLEKRKWVNKTFLDFNPN